MYSSLDIRTGGTVTLNPSRIFDRDNVGVSIQFTDKDGNWAQITLNSQQAVEFNNRLGGYIEREQVKA